MSWTPFSAEAVNLSVLVNKLQKHGRISEALEAIGVALEKAHKDGPSNITYAQFERASEDAYAQKWTPAEKA